MATRRVVTAAAAGLIVAGAASASRRAAQRAARDFYDWRGSTEEWPALNGIPARCPGFVNRLEMFGSFHAADPAAVAGVLPSTDLRPVRLLDGRAILFVGGLHYRDITNSAFIGAMAPPYGEVMVAAMVTRGDAVPLLPLAATQLPLPAAWRAGMFPLFIPVTHRWARDAAWAMGLPKFVADLDFEESNIMREVRGVEGGRPILRLRVPMEGNVRASHQPMLTYASAEGRLWVVEAPMFAYQRMGVGARGIELELGDHPVADRMRELGISSKAFASLCSVAGRFILPDRRAIGSAQPYGGYRGEDRWFGRYTIRYPGTAPVDQYSYLTRQGIESAVSSGGGQLVEDYATIDDDLGRSPEPGPSNPKQAREGTLVAAG
jgi:Acetoacetate decarboxylase (ADC)